ncbi:MAG: hypothetical protein AB1756_09415 [Acidobacteriota bacterium]
MQRYFLGSCFLNITLLILSTPAFSQQANFAEKAEGAIYALQASYDVETNLLKKDLSDYHRISVELGVILEKLRDLYNEMDALLKKESATALTPIEMKEMEIDDAEKQRAYLIEEGERSREKIRERLARLALLNQKIAELKEMLPREEESLTGKWDISLLPGGDKGIFWLKQSGTIVTGQYQLEGGWKGSLQGTFVDRKIFLQKIDSKLGRSGEYEGFLSQDGKSVRGTWMDYDVSGGKASSGSWVATRREG